MKWLWIGVLASLPTLSAGTAPRQTPTPYSRWQYGPGKDASYFPIAVWLQDPQNAARFKAAGINLYVGLWKGPTEEQLAALKAAGMPVICEQNAVGLAHRSDSTIVGWMHGDEPDNAQPMRDPATGKESYGPCIPPERIVSDYERKKAADPSRPILLNLGQGVANDRWVGRGNGAKQSDYLTYVKGGDIVSYDVYPVAGLGEQNNLGIVALGLDRLAKWSEGKRILWDCIETGIIGDPAHKPTPAQVKAEVWMSLIHGAKGLIYFVHQFQPRFNEHALLDDPEMLAAVTAVNKQIYDLAPALNSPSEHLMVRNEPEGDVSAMLKRQGNTLYLFAVGMTHHIASATFLIPGVTRGSTATALGEPRKVDFTGPGLQGAGLPGGIIKDDFAPYQVHIYRITLGREP